MNTSGIQGAGDPAKRRAADFYPTPWDVTAALLTFLELPKDQVIWEPACGEWHMAWEIADAGYEVIGTDIRAGVDFLTAKNPGCDWIITNPPFSDAEAFISHALDLGIPTAMLLKSQFWQAKKRLPLFERRHPEYILPLTWRPDFLWEQPGIHKPLMDVMWCVWSADYGHGLYRPLPRPKVRYKAT